MENPKSTQEVFEEAGWKPLASANQTIISDLPPDKQEGAVITTASFYPAKGHPADAPVGFYSEGVVTPPITEGANIVHYRVINGSWEFFFPNR